MIINKVRETVEFPINKNQNGGMPSADEFSNLCRQAQINIINREVVHKGAEIYSYCADEIAWVKAVEEVTVTSNAAPRPDRFMYLLNMDYGFTYNEGGVTKKLYKNVDMLRENEFNRRMNSNITNPTTKYPIAKWTQTGFEVHPDGITKVRLTFIKQPVDPAWAFTLDSRGRPVFDEANSTDFELPESMANELALEILSEMGINTREIGITNIAEQKLIDE